MGKITKSFTIDEKIIKKAKREADKRRRSLSSVVEWALESHLKDIDKLNK